MVDAKVDYPAACNAVEKVRLRELPQLHCQAVGEGGLQAGGRGCVHASTPVFACGCCLLQVLVHQSHLTSGALDKIQAALQEAGVQVRAGLGQRRAGMQNCTHVAGLLQQ